MGDRFPAAIERLRTNAEALRAAPEAFLILAIAAFAVSGFALSRHYGARLAALEHDSAAEAALVADYRAKLDAVAPEREAVRARIAKLSAVTASLRQQLSDDHGKILALQQRRRDRQQLYEDDTPIAQVEDPRMDLAAKKVTFPLVTSEVLLSAGKSYEYRNWKLACGGSQSYSAVDDGPAPEFSYSHLDCRIVGPR